MKKIVQKDDPVLRQKARAVPISEITSDEIQKIIKDMREALKAENDGVGLAAPQIGYSLRIFIVAPDLQRKNQNRKHQGEITDEKEEKAENTVFINPEIIKLSKETKKLDEGCLSVRPLYGKVTRKSRATIKAYNEKGELFQRGASGLLAQIFQHEMDHLEGVLFIDKADDVHEIKIDKTK